MPIAIQEPKSNEVRAASEAQSAMLPRGLIDLMLVRLAASGSAVTTSSWRAAIKPFFVPRTGLSESQWRTVFEDAIATLLDVRFIEEKPYCITSTGRERVVSLLGIDAMPDLPWKTLKNRYLIAAALAIEPLPHALRQLGTAKFLYATIIKQHYELPLDGVPTEAQALDALAWKQLAAAHPETLPIGRKAFSRNAVLDCLFFEGQATTNRTGRLAAIITNCANANPDRIRQCVINRWLDGAISSGLETQEPATHVGSAMPEAEDAANAALPFNSVAFATELLQLAEQDRDGRYGEHKVFLCHLWEKFHRAHPAINRRSFEKQLLLAQREGLVVLSRADLVSAMDPERVRRSEVHNDQGNGTFHFLRLS